MTLTKIGKLVVWLKIIKYRNDDGVYEAKYRILHPLTFPIIAVSIIYIILFISIPNTIKEIYREYSEAISLFGHCPKCIGEAWIKQ